MTGAALRWLFVGQGEMGAAALDTLVRHRPPTAVVTAEPALGDPPVVRAAATGGLACHHAARVGAEPARSWPELFTDVDVVVCACWTERLAPSALAAAAHGWMNLHPSALPAWRGADPVAWQLLSRPQQIGCSVHRMTERHDAGPVVARGVVAVESDDDRGAVLRRSGHELGELAAGVLERLAAGARLSEEPQHDADATWCPPPGTVPSVDPRVLDAEPLAAVARAFSPQPGVEVATLPGGRRFAVTGVGTERAADDDPGSVVGLDVDAVALACRDRWVHGRVWAVADPPGPPVPTELSAPGATRLPRGRS